MTQRIKYSIENCGDIDADFNVDLEDDTDDDGSADIADCERLIDD